MMKHPDTLMAKVFKARYFPNGSFLTANLGVNPSYVWSSVYAAQSLIKTKSRLHVGTGSEISVFFDPWLPHTSNPFVETVLVVGLEELTVSSLRLGLTAGWDVNLVKALFSERDWK
ncbi:hypothetical protein LguiA_025770 [Lonicera macranthoides]